MNDPVLPEPRLAMAESRIRRPEETIGHLQHFTIGGGSLAAFAALKFTAGHTGYSASLPPSFSYGGCSESDAPTAPDRRGLLNLRSPGPSG